MKPNVQLETEAFKAQVKKLRSEFNTVVETGTNTGTGTTKIFADNGFEVYSCEMNVLNYDKAKALHGNNEKVHLHYAFSCDLKTLDPVNQHKYKDCQDIEQNFLAKQIKSHGSGVLYCLDSHWTMGFREFSQLIQHHIEFGERLVIILDDVTNLKHRPSIRFLDTMYPHPHTVEHKPGERWATITLHAYDTNVSTSL